MISDPKKSSSLIKVAPSSWRNVLAQFLVACLLIQTAAPAAFASQPGPRRPGEATSSLYGGAAATLRGLALGAGNPATGLLAYVNAALAPQENWNIVLTPIGTEFHNHTGLDYHQPNKKLLVSANSPSGSPNNFELLAADGGHSAFSNVAGLNDDVLVAAARAASQVAGAGGFQPGTLFTTTGVAGAVARIDHDGATVQNPWVMLPTGEGLITGLHVDRTGVFGGDLLVVTAGGGVWRVNASATPTRLAKLDTPLAGVAAVADDTERYGPWAGRVLVGAKEQGSVYAVDAQGQSTSLQVGVNPQDIDIVPAHENLFALDAASRKVLGAPEGAFAGIIGDILITQQSPGRISRLRWDGTEFVVNGLAEAAELKQVAFAPAGVGELRAVKQVYEKIAVVRHAPVLNSGRVEGSLWQLSPESVVLDGNDTITSDLLVPGTPGVTATDKANFGGTVDGGEDPLPGNYTISIGGNASLRHVVTRTNPIEPQPVAAPPAPAGARDVSLSKAGETFGAAATLRNLSLSGKAGAVAVPPGTYGRFAASGHTALVFGVAGSAEPTVYNLEDLSLGGGSELRLNGPVILTVKNSVTLSGSTAGSSSDPRLLVLQISGAPAANTESGLKLSGNSVLYGVVRAPQRDIIVTGNGRLRGTVSCDYLFVNGNGVLQITENDIPPPPVNRPPTADAGPAHTITLPTDTVALEGAASDDGLPAGSALTSVWTKVSGPGTVTFAAPGSPATLASFSAEGQYVLKLTASDGQLSSSDTAIVTVVPRNQQPVVEAGPAQTIRLPAPAELRGTVTDDALPRGSSVTVTWNFVAGPAAVTFADRHAAATAATFSLPGTYTLRLSATDTEFTVSDEVVVTVLSNEAPVVNAGPDLEVTLPSVVALAGAATDDGQPQGSTLETSWGMASGPAPAIFHDAYAAATGVTFTVPGTYVLRLTASDSELSASDEVTVVVHSKPNGPPEITSEPATELLLGAVPTGGGEIVSLVPWTSTQYDLNTQPNANWVKDATNTIVTQTVNADPSFFLSDFNLSNAQMEGTWRVNTTTDDDFVGFVFGYQNAGHFYLFDWKQGSQNDPLGFAERGMSLKVFSADTALGGGDFWPTAGNGARVRTLYHNTVGWAEFTDYQFTLQFHPGEIHIIVKRGATVLADFTVNDATYTNGRFGFYNYSQEQVRYSGFRRLSLAQGTYTYDVEAVDPDGDSLTYSLDAAPLGMTINSTSGLITWPVSSVVAGDHQVVVRTREPNGGFDTQAYTLTILNPNQPPAVGAGDDRLINTGSAATLNGTATDDGFPRNSALAVSWSKVSGPGTVNFANASSAATTATFSQSGAYLLRLTANDGALTASDEVAVTVNTTPVVNAGANQTLTQSNTVVLAGTVTDDGVPSGGPLSIVWSQVSGPVGVSFTDPGSPSTRAIFPSPGTYTLRLTGNDSLHAGTDDVTVTVNASPALDGATLNLAAANVGPYATGSAQPLRATLRNSAGGPLAGYGVEFEVTGPNATGGSAVTDASGVAIFSHTGANLGTDPVRAFVRNGAASINSPAVSMTWAQATTSPAAVQGWIGAPLDGSTAAGVVPVTVGAGVTLAQGVVEYWPAANPSAVTVLAPAAQGGPGTTVAALDTTLLANGNYVVRLRATDSTGQQLVSQVTVTVVGENKPGRITLSFTDLTVPVSGTPITIERQYDSLERNHVGDFGHGWSLDMSGPRLEVSPDHDVTLTDPVSGRRVTFQFAPASFGFPFSFLYQPAYAPEPGVFGKLSANGCGMLIRSGGGVACYLSSSPEYRPTTYTYTDPYGRVYTLTAAGKLASMKNLDGNVLTFSAAGITSSAGNLTVAFARDAQGRITQITDPAGKLYQYDYDAAGDLVAVKLPDSEVPLRYEYEAGHFFRKSTDSRGHAESVTTYHPDGRLASVTDAMGETTAYAYDLATNTTTVTHPDGAGTTVQRHDARGLLLSETDPLGRTRSFTYDANRNKRTETDALGKTTAYDYDAGGHIKSVTDPLGKTTTYVNNQFGQPVTTTDPLGKVRTLSYDADANLTNIGDELGTYVSFNWNDTGSPLAMADGDGRTTRFTYDAFGNVLTKTDALGRVTTYTYDQMGRALTMTDPRGTTRFTYDPLGRTLSVTDPLDHVTHYEYDANGNRTAEVDARQRRTAHEYDAANRLTKTVHPDGMALEVAYNFRGQKVSETVSRAANLAAFAAAAAPDEPARTTTYVYDNAGQLVKVILPDESEVSFTYDELGRVRTATDERGQTLTYEYDALCGCSERLTKIIGPDGKASTYTYDDAGRRTSFVDANNRQTRYEYDARDNVVKYIYPDNTTVTNTFDGMGRVLTATDQESRVTRFTYDGVGNIVSVVDAQNQTTVHSYDAQDNLLSTTDAKGNTTRYEYDALDRLSKRVLPLGMFESFAYDEVGNLSARTDYRGKRTSYEYDPMNRLLAKRPDATLGEPAVTFSYTLTGERRAMTDASGTTNYVYDLRDRLSSKETPQGTLSYGYDAAGNLTSMRSSNADGASVDYTYDDLNRLEQVVDHRLAATTTAYTYDPVGNLKSKARPNGVRDDYVYDTRNLLTSLSTGRAGATQASYAYTLDRTGRRLSSTEHTGRTYTYTYDALYRLTREAVTNDPNPAKNGAVDYTLDPVGNRLSRTSTLEGVLNATSSYDANNRLVSDAYDANGNARLVGGRSFAYDFENRVKGVDGAAVRVVYDGDGNLAAKTVGGVTTRYLVDDLNPTGYAQVVEELVGGEVERQYTYGNAIVSQRLRAAGSWDVRFYSTDGHGSVRQLTDAAGSVTDTYDYDAYGKLISQTGATPNAYLFAGERFDADLGLYHFRARSYDADRGRFTSVDPFPGFIDEPVSLHKYLYANADPVNFIDPSGLVAASEYGAFVKRIALRIVAAVRTVGRAIACVLFFTASWIASVAGYWAWALVRRAAMAVRWLNVSFCICKISPTIRGYKGPTAPQNWRQGISWEEALVDYFLAGGYDVRYRRGLRKYTPLGRRDIDMEITRGGTMTPIEAKTGGSPYEGTPQADKDDWLRRRRRYPKVEVRRWQVWRCAR
ncbi:MAG: RHS repeat-associated core domain-containing protein [Pyrinomonadaceae bacterium]